MPRSSTTSARAAGIPRRHGPASRTARSRPAEALAAAVALAVSSACTAPAEAPGPGTARVDAGPRGGASTAPRCAPSAGGPHWIEEGQALSVTVGCATGRAMPGGAFELAELPDGAAYDPASGRLSWTPRLDQAAVYRVTIRVPALGESGEVNIGVADRFDAPGNAAITDPARYTEEFGLPVLHLTISSGINRDGYTPASAVYRGKRYPMIEAKYRGASSFGYPKKNFTLKFPKDDKFDEPFLAGGFRKKRKLMLITPFDDAAHVRWRLALELWNRMDERNIRIQHFSGVLYVNGQYQGLYTFADKIDGFLMEDHGLHQDGNIYMGINHNANFAPFRYNEPLPQDESALKADLAEGYEKKDGFPREGEPGAFDDIRALTEFVARADDATFTAEIGRRIDLRNYYDWIIHATLVQAWDTLAKNALHYHDPVVDEPWRVVLWDFNESFGQRWQTERFARFVDPADIVHQPKGGFGYTNRNYLWRRLWSHPLFGKDLRKRYGQMLRGPLALDDVLDALERFVGEVAPAVPRDERKWQHLHLTFPRFAFRGDFNDFWGEVDYVRRWIEGRWAFLLPRYP